MVLSIIEKSQTPIQQLELHISSFTLQIKQNKFISIQS